MNLEQQERRRETKLAYYHRNKGRYADYSREHYQKNRAVKLASQRAVRVGIIQSICMLLGDKCAKCGFDDHRALQIDHLNGKGYQHRLRSKGTAYYKEILTDLSEGRLIYQLLCANCNFIEGIIKGYRKSIWN